MSKFVSLLKELGTALHVQDLEGIVNDALNEDTLDSQSVVSAFSKAATSQVEGVMKNYLAEKKKREEAEERASTLKDEGYKSGTRKAKETDESIIKEVFGLQESKAERFEDLVKEAFSKVKSTSQDNEPDKSVKEYQDKLAAIAKELDDVKKDKERTVSEMIAAQKRKESEDKVTKIGINQFLSLKPILSEDDKKRSNQIKIATDALLKENWNTEGDEPILLDDAGNHKLDDKYQPITFAKAVESITGSIFDFSQSTQRTAPNAKDSNNEPPKGDTLAFLNKRPETEEEVYQLANDSKYTIEQRKAIIAYGEDKGLVK